MMAPGKSLLSQPVQFLKGVGPRKAETLAGLVSPRWGICCFYVPRRYLDRTTVQTIAQLRSAGDLPELAPDAEIRREATVVGTVRSFRVMGVGRKARFVLILGDDTGSLQCVWFGGVHYWKTRFTIGDTLAVSGQPTRFSNVLQFVHPDVDWIGGTGEQEGTVDWSRALHAGGLVPCILPRSNSPVSDWTAPDSDACWEISFAFTRKRYPILCLRRCVGSTGLCRSQRRL